jgi:biotin-(acetyl-CoA carboxylase) ligase
MNWTKEPWKYRKLAIANYDIVHDHGTDQIECAGGTTTEANARRIVACVNACVGISTNVLETLEDKTLNEMFKRQETEYQAQRDMLLAALKDVVENWSAQFERQGHLAPEWAKRARSVIVEIEATK